MKQYIVFTTLFLLLFSACSDKKVYEPIHLSGEWKEYEAGKHRIIDTASNVALLDDAEVLTKKDETISFDINSSNRVLSYSDGWVISASIDGNVTLVSKEGVQQQINLLKTVAAATLQGDILAVLFADNEIALYDLQTKKPLFKEQGTKVLAVDSRVQNPYFLNDLVLFSTLDGKVIFVHTKLKKRLRTVIVSSEDNFNNIISLHILQNKIIAATGYMVAAIAEKELREKYEIRDIVYDDANIYLTTKQGEILSLNPDLQTNAKIKLPFAHFYAMVLRGDKLYVLEKEGYLIVVDTKSFEYKVYEVDFDDGFVFPSQSSFYVDDKKILTE